MTTPDFTQMAELLIIQAKELYAATTVGHAAPIVETIHAAIKNPKPGDLVFEWMLAYRPLRSGINLDAIGILIRTEEHPRKGKVWVIQAWSGKEMKWKNAEFHKLLTESVAFPIPEVFKF